MASSLRLKVVVMGKSVLVIVAHPDLQASRANRFLAKAAAAVDGVTVHNVYDTYPDLFIDGGAERQRLAAADAIVLQHPIYWYAWPGLLKEWIDRTLSAGWAYGPGGTALHGKLMMSSITTGSSAKAYGPSGPHGHRIDDYLKPARQIATFCGMNWQEPLVLHHARSISDDELAAHAEHLTARLKEMTGRTTGGAD